jgi:hypothetical protein
MRRRWIVALLALASLASCVPSINPLYTDKDLVVDPALVGTWIDNDNETWTFATGTDKSYSLVIDHDGKSGPFVAHLVALGGYRFLDIMPTDGALNQSGLLEMYRAMYIRTHMFLKVSQVTPTLKMAFLDADWLKKLLTKSPAALRHERRESDDDSVVTASTAELQAFMIRYGNTADAWGSSNEFKRKAARRHVGRLRDAGTTID